MKKWLEDAVQAEAQRKADRLEEEKDTRSLRDLASEILGVEDVPADAETFVHDGVILSRLDMADGSRLAINIPLPGGGFYGGPVRSAADAGKFIEEAQAKGARLP